MYRVSYIQNNKIYHKGNLETESAAREWVSNQGNSIKPMKLLKWDEDIDCYSTVEVFNSDRGNATGTYLYKTVRA